MTLSCLFYWLAHHEVYRARASDGRIAAVKIIQDELGEASCLHLHQFTM
jgi:hypothetical protein